MSLPLPWATPQEMPSLDAEGQVVVMASRLRLASFRDVPGFLIAALRIRRQMLATPGSLGLSLIAKPGAKTFWTLSAWRDQRSLGSSVGAQPHLDVMKRYRSKMAGSQFLTWTMPARQLPPTWPDALTRLTSAED